MSEEPPRSDAVRRMAAFDRNTPQVREALRNASYWWPDDLSVHRGPQDLAVEFIQRQDAKRAEEDRLAKGI